jgi:Tol biopolymer transport system component
MTITAPPRAPQTGDPVDRDELEALIEEARRRARRRRRIYGAVVALAALVGVATFTIIDRAAPSQSGSPASGTQVSLSAATANSKIAFLREPDGNGRCCDYSELWVMNPDGSGQQRVTRRPEGFAPAWSPDARRIAFVRQRRGARLPGGGHVNDRDIYLVNADGSGERRLTSGPVQSIFPAWSPDGRRIAFARRSGPTLGAYKTDIYVINADGSGQRKLTQDSHVQWGPVWSPDGRKIAFRTRSGIYVINADGGGQRKLAPGVFPAWSPDGRKIAFTVASDTAPDQERIWEIYVMNPDGSGQRKLTPGLLPVWSPDGRKIAFLGDGGVYVMNADGTGQRRLGDSLPDVAPSWSPDGRQVLFSRFVGHVSAAVREHGGDAEGNFEIYVANVDGSGSRNLTRNPGDDAGATWSATTGP